MWFNKTYIIIVVLLIIAGVLMYYTVRTMPSVAVIQKSESFDPNQKPTGVKPKEADAEIILYYTEWCGYSRMFLPEWEKFEKYAKENMTNVRVDKVRCEGGNENVCKQKGVEGYPTVILTLKNGKDITFQDERTSDKLIEFVKISINGQ